MPAGPPQRDCGSIRLPTQGDKAVRTIRAVWRRLTGGRSVRDAARPTLLACSGGADSSALVLALGGLVSKPDSKPHLVVAHIVHDLRPEPDAQGDRDAVRELCAQIGLPFVEASVRIAARPGNAEANARAARYEALAVLAERHGCRFIATAHHADDQLETMLMRLLRGSGPGGLSGIAPSRPLANTTLVRPMLSVGRAEGERLCTEASWCWRTDATNADESRLRSALRARVLPQLGELGGDLGPRLARTAELLDNAQQLADDRVKQLLGSAHEPQDSVHADRAALRTETPLVIGTYLRRACAQLGISDGADTRTAKALWPIIEAIRDDSTDPRRWPLAGVEVRVDAHVVVVTRSA